MNESHLTIEPLQEKHLGAVIALWKIQADKFLKIYPFLPDEWNHDHTVGQFVKSHIRNEHSIVVRSGHDVVGYMTYDMFEFHQEKTAFLPIPAHCADDDEKIAIYQIMYRYLSEKFVELGCLNHMCTFFSHDNLLQQYLFELGFGLYAVDAFQDSHYEVTSLVKQDVQIRKADINDAGGIHTLLRTFHDYYQRAPLFLKRELETIDDIHACLVGEEKAVFVALKDEHVIGFMNVITSEGFDPITLIGRSTGCIEPLGAYIQDAYRGAGIGSALLEQVFAWCRQRDLRNVHVDFESANQNAHLFWPKYFHPMLYSVKRRINNDW